MRGIGRGIGRGLGSYILGDRYVTPDRRLSQMLMRQGSRGGPSNSWQETLGRIAQQLSGAYIGKLDQDKQDIANQAFAKVEPDSFRPPTDAEAMATPGMRDLELAAMSGMAGDGQGQTVTAPLPDDQLMQQGGIPGTLDKISRYNAGLSGDSNRSTDDIEEFYQKEMGDQALNAGIDLQAQNFQDEMEQRRAASTVPRPRDFRAELAQGMQDYQADDSNRIMNEKKPQLEYAMQNLRGLENNPYAQRLLQGLMMNQINTDAASRLDAIARERQLADAARTRGFAIEDATRDRSYSVEDRDLLAQNKLDVKNAGLGTGPFRGTGMDAQDSNMLINGDPSSAGYRSSYARMSEPKTTFDQNTGQWITINPDMSGYRLPTGSVAGQRVQTQTPQQPPGQPSVSVLGYPQGNVLASEQPQQVGGIPTGSAPWADLPTKEQAKMQRTIYSDSSKMLEKNRANLEKTKTMGESLKRFKYLNSIQDTGSFADRITDFSFDDEKREMVKITNLLTPQMRQGMPGAASDRDVAMFRGATVGIDVPKEINDNVIAGMMARLENANNRQSFMEDYFATNKHLAGAEGKWKEYLETNPIFDPDPSKEGQYALNLNRKSYREFFEGNDANVGSSTLSPDKKKRLKELRRKARGQ